MKKVLYWLPRVIASFILLQTLFFKFTASPESIYIFETMGMEPWGRIGTGILELIAGIILLIPSVSRFGALLALGLMAGAIGSHLTKLGIEVMGDGGQLFGMGIGTFVCAGIVMYQERGSWKQAGSQ